MTNLKVSSADGEKCPITSLTEMQHGKPIPLSNFLDFLLLKTLSNSASMNVSTSPHTVATSAPSTQSPIALSRAAKKEKNMVKICLQGILSEKTLRNHLKSYDF